MKLSKNSWILVGLIFSLVTFSGCFLFLLGGAAAGGYAVSKDTIEGMTEKSEAKVYNAARDVMMSEGFIRIEDKTHGIIEGEVRKSKVEVDVRKMTDKTVRLQVKVRRGYNLMPHIKLANELYNKISQKID